MFRGLALKQFLALIGEQTKFSFGYLLSGQYWLFRTRVHLPSFDNIKPFRHCWQAPVNRFNTAQSEATHISVFGMGVNPDRHFMHFIGGSDFMLLSVNLIV